jgi:hypothetical protein
LLFGPVMIVTLPVLVNPASGVGPVPPFASVVGSDPFDPSVPTNDRLVEPFLLSVET